MLELKRSTRDGIKVEKEWIDMLMLDLFINFRDLFYSQNLFKKNFFETMNDDHFTMNQNVTVSSERPGLFILKIISVPSVS